MTPSPKAGFQHIWLFLGWLLFTLIGFGAIFYGTAITMAALVTYSRFSRFSGGRHAVLPSQIEALAVAQHVAREGVLYGLLFVTAGLLLMMLAGTIGRYQDRITTLESRRRDMQAHENRKSKL